MTLFLSHQRTTLRHTSVFACGSKYRRSQGHSAQLLYSSSRIWITQGSQHALVVKYQIYYHFPSSPLIRVITSTLTHLTLLY